jgi:hypothetical protein
MRKSLFLAVLLTFASLVFAAKSFNLTFNGPAQVGGVELKSGAYEVRVAGDKVIFKNANFKEFSIPVKSVAGDKKFEYTSTESSTKDGKEMVKAIHLGGSTTTLEFADQTLATK